ncbi:nitrilase-related carbon-nitrogen hydrolase, partial [Fodinibius sp.]|uniref:nitrilase-related carbon-nitrogen hydrolase n=1 Tax=Fodinibius sp. TaxID=1872440 RepID=UPI0035630086
MAGRSCNNRQALWIQRDRWKSDTAGSPEHWDRLAFNFLMIKTLHTNDEHPDMDVKIAACQMEVSPGHPDANAAKMLNLIEQAKANRQDIVIFPEMAVPGYLIGDEWENRAFVLDCYRYNE